MFDLFKTNVVMKLKQHVKENIVNVLSLNSAVTMESVSLRDGVVIMKTVTIAVLLLLNIIFSYQNFNNSNFLIFSLHQLNRLR